MAAAWCDYLEQHARKVYASELRPDLDSASTLADKIRNGSVQDGAAVREIYRHEWDGLATYTNVEQALKVLESYNWVRFETRVSGSSGGRPSSIIRLHPSLRDVSHA